MFVEHALHQPTNRPTDQTNHQTPI